MLTGSVFLRRPFQCRVLHLYFPLPATMLIARVLVQPVYSCHPEQTACIDMSCVRILIGVSLAM